LFEDKMPSIRLGVLGMRQEVLSPQGVASHDLVQRRGVCGAELILEAGDVLESGKWYQGICPESANGKDGGR
jgi:hypothetical protein